VEEGSDYYARFNAALVEDRFADAFRSLVLAVGEKTVRILRAQSIEVEWREPIGSAFVIAAEYHKRFSEIIEYNEIAAPEFLEVRDAFGTISETGLNSSIKFENQNNEIRFLLFWGFRLGQLDASLDAWDTGLFETFINVANKLHRVGSPRREMVANWQKRILPDLIKYVAERTKVTLAELVRFAKKWAEENRRPDDNLEFPATDDGIRKGLTRLEARGLLVIPGRLQSRG
jgi:hypothetical protein